MVEIDPKSTRNLPKEDPEFPELKKRREFDMEMVRRKAIEAGLDPDRVEEHVREHYKGQAAGHAVEDEVRLLRELGIEGLQEDETGGESR